MANINEKIVGYYMGSIVLLDLRRGAVSTFASNTTGVAHAARLDYQVAWQKILLWTTTTTTAGRISTCRCFIASGLLFKNEGLDQHGSEATITFEEQGKERQI